MLCLTDLGWINKVRVDDKAVRRRLEDLLSSRSVSSGNQSSWLARAIQCIDLTTLAGNLFSKKLFIHRCE